jgi:hypothetical protein
MVNRWATHIAERRSIVEFWQWLWTVKRGRRFEDINIEEALNEYHEIDPKQLEVERRGILEEFTESTQPKEGGASKDPRIVSILDDVVQNGLAKWQVGTALFFQDFGNGYRMILQVAARRGKPNGVEALLTNSAGLVVDRTQTFESLYSKFVTSVEGLTHTLDFSKGIPTSDA